MLRPIACTAVAASCLIMALSAPQSANAFWPDLVQHKVSAMEMGRHQNQMWPYPYVCPDRQWTAAPFETMIHNGWRQQNLLGAHHFEAETNKLTRAGELKVRWILTQAPEAHRQVYVERDIDPAITEHRVSSALAFAEIAAMDGQSPAVTDTHIVSQGRTAAAVDHVNQSYRENMMPAVLPTSAGTAGSTQ
jgi:hypothetical protein